MNENPAEKAIAKQFGKLVGVLRVKKRFTQDAFAYHAGISRSYYGEIERGEVSVSVYKADLIAKGLGLELGELMLLLDKDRKKGTGKD
ncbi:MAG TPA: helix-turn-helix transcriptional regulator [Candidatus Omnitrophota bacterium]|nr:helix-turn-helix transcriptional regulator [Candidatus Omnitrophota bacterium]